MGRVYDHSERFDFGTGTPEKIIAGSDGRRSQTVRVGAVAVMKWQKTLAVWESISGEAAYDG